MSQHRVEYMFACRISQNILALRLWDDGLVVKSEGLSILAQYTKELRLPNCRIECSTVVKDKRLVRVAVFRVSRPS